MITLHLDGLGLSLFTLDTVMSKFIKIFLGTSSFDLEVDLSDTMLEVKQKIEKSQHIPVSKQTLYFLCKALEDDLDTAPYQDYSLQLIVSPDPNPNHNETLQTEQLAPPPSNPPEMIIEGHQDSPATTVQTEQLPPPSNPTEDIINGQDLAREKLAPPLNPLMEDHWPSTSRLRDLFPDPEGRILVYVSAYPWSEYPVAVIVKMIDTVKELRRTLFKIQEGCGELILPEEGSYFFLYKDRVLNENHPFWLIGVKKFDSINIISTSLAFAFPGSFTFD